MPYEDRVTDQLPYAKHVGVVCKCGMRAHTKNIAPIGCRTVFPKMDTDEDIEKKAADEIVFHQSMDLFKTGKPVKYVLIDARTNQCGIDIIAKHWESVKCTHEWKVDKDAVE